MPGVAIAALRAAGWKLSPAAYETGLIKADWPARMQRLRQGRLAALIPSDSELWLDGGHNPDGGRAIAAALADLEERVPRPLVMVAGMLATKDHANFFRHFAGLASRLYAIPIPHQEKSLPPAEIVKTAQEIGIPAEAADDIDDALGENRQALAHAGAAHPDRRLALSRGRNPERERHAAGMMRK